MAGGRGLIAGPHPRRKRASHPCLGHYISPLSCAPCLLLSSAPAFILSLPIDSCVELLYETLGREGDGGKPWVCCLAPRAFAFLLLVQKVVSGCCLERF